jgi:hypothetical protein
MRGVTLDRQFLAATANRGEPVDVALPDGDDTNVESRGEA